MNLGALIYDSSKEPGPMYVYRMQKWDPVNKLMAGPYTYSSLINASWNTDSDSAQPDPDYDFPPEDLETEEFKSADVRFGFLHPEDAKRWFGSGFEKLISVGFSMHKIPAS